MTEPHVLSALLAKQLERFAPGTREHSIRKSLLDACENDRECRELILGHPDAAPKLCEPPLGYQRPQQWNGYIPPEICDEKRNDSPRRAALIALLGQAMEPPARLDTP